MAAGKDARSAKPHPTTVDRKSERELIVTRTFDAPARLVFEAWARPELFQRWWAPKSIGASLVSCTMDVRTGGTYRLEFAHPAAAEPMAFFGRYLEVVPPTRLVWTNDENSEGAVTTVTFEERDGETLLTLSELYPSREAFERNVGAADAMPEQFAQLDGLLATLDAG
jgi:uncharacterized protein YndB with AHSA1/START domain